MPKPEITPWPRDSNNKPPAKPGRFITLGAQYVFTGIAACVIGGILLTGGYGSLLGSAFGAVTYGIVSLGVFFLGWNADLTELFIGMLLLLAVMANNRLRTMAMGR